jgi:hypothetical protein
MLHLRTALLAAGIALGFAAPASAQSQPIQSPQDAACREEATRRVFGDPNPGNVDPYVRGRQFWNACMARAKSKGTPRGKGKRSRRG